jgi:uncharacterized membrane protein YtjA (UPF0391 family)
MRKVMSQWSLVALSAAILLGLFGFSGIITAAAGPAKMLACIFLVAFLFPLLPSSSRKSELPPATLRASR